MQKKKKKKILNMTIYYFYLAKESTYKDHNLTQFIIEFQQRIE